MLTWNSRANCSGTGSSSAYTVAANSSTPDILRNAGAEPTSTRRSTRRGAATATCWATKLPIEWPTTVARSRWSASMSARTSAAMSRMAYPPSGLSESPWPRWSGAITW